MTVTPNRGLHEYAGTDNVRDDIVTNLTADMVNLDTHVHDAADITTGIIGTDNLGGGTPDNTKVLRGDGQWADISGLVDTSGLATTTALNNHINDTSAAHAASAIGVTPVGTIASTDVQAALAELDSEKLATGGNINASQISAGTVAAARLGSGSPSSTTFLNGAQAYAVPDHNALGNLTTGDPHTQYHTDARHAAIDHSTIAEASVSLVNLHDVTTARAATQGNTIQQGAFNAYYTVADTAISVESAGAAHCDLKRSTGGAMSSVTNTTTLTVSGGDTFTSTAVDAGKVILVPGAGAAGADLLTTIASVNNSTSAVLSVAASTTVSGKIVFWGTDDTSAVNTAVGALPATGGTVFIPRPTMCNGSFSWNSKKHVRILGWGGDSGGADTATGGPNPTLPASCLFYPKSGSATFIDATQTHQFEVDSCAILYGNAGYTGKLLDLTGDATTNTNPITKSPRLANLKIGTAIDGLVGCVLVTDTYAWRPRYENVNFRGGAIQIQCADAAFVNGRTFDHCTWAHYGTVAIRNVSECTNIQGGMVERTYDASTSANRLGIFIDSGAGTTSIQGLNLNGVWFSDVNDAATAESWITLSSSVTSTPGEGGISITGCRMGGGANQTFFTVGSNWLRGIAIVGGDAPFAGTLFNAASKTNVTAYINSNSIHQGTSLTLTANTAGSGTTVATS